MAKNAYGQDDSTPNPFSITTSWPVDTFVLPGRVWASLEKQPGYTVASKDIVRPHL